MVNDIQTELHKRDTTVFCEVYDGQFHDIILHDHSNYPLTRLQLCKHLFSDCMESLDKSELVDSLLPYSQVNADDTDVIYSTPFWNEHQLELECITISMK